MLLLSQDDQTQAFAARETAALAIGESMKKLLEELQQELYAIGSSVYQQPGNQPPAASTSDQNDSSDKSGDDVIDADFTETKD